MIKITKSITFDLDSKEDTITLPTLMAVGYTRSDSIKLFETLQSLGYGEYREGNRGRNCFHRFLKNEKCPKEFTLHIEQQPRGRPRTKVSVETILVRCSPIEADLDEVSQEINSGKLKLVITDVVVGAPKGNETTNMSSNQNIETVTMEDDSLVLATDGGLTQAVEVSETTEINENPAELVELVDQAPVSTNELANAIEVQSSDLDQEVCEAKEVADLGEVASSMVVIPQPPVPQVQPSTAAAEEPVVEVTTAS